MGEDATSRVLGGSTAGTASGGVRASGLLAGASGGGLSGGTAPPATAAGGATAFALAGGTGPTGGQSAPAGGGAGAAVSEPNGSIGRVGLFGTDAYTKAEADARFVNTDPAGDTMAGLLTTPSGPLQASAAAGNTLTWGPEGLYVPTPPERATLLYRHSSNPAMADPGPGYARSNAIGAAVTALAFDTLTAAGTDATPLLRVLREGDSVYIQDQDDAAHWARFVVDGAPLDQAGWFRVPVAYVSGSDTSPGNNERLDVTFTMAPPTATAPGDYAQLLIASSAPAAPAPEAEAFWFNPTEEA